MSYIPQMGGDMTGPPTSAQLKTGVIVDADVSNSAAIQQLKVSGLRPDLAIRLRTDIGGTMEGPLVLAGNPTEAYQAATKRYVDNGGNDLPGARRHFFRAAANIGHGVNTDIVGGWSPGTGDTGEGLMTFNNAGVVFVNDDAVLDIVVQLFWAGNANGRRMVTILVGGVEWWSQTTVGSPGTTTQCLAVPGYKYALGTQFQIRVLQDSGGVLSLTSGRWSLRRAAEG